MTAAENRSRSRLAPLFAASAGMAIGGLICSCLGAATGSERATTLLAAFGMVAGSGAGCLVANKTSARLFHVVGSFLKKSERSVGDRRYRTRAGCAVELRAVWRRR